MCLDHVYIVLEPVGSARLKFGDDQYFEFLCFDVPKVVRSPGYDHKHDEEFRNGQDINIDILEGYIRTPGWFRSDLDIFRSTGRLPEPPGRVMGLMGLSGEREGRPAWAARPLPLWSELD